MYQSGGVFNAPTLGVFGENGPEALIPLSGTDRKYGLELLNAIIPRYYPELMHATGGLFGTNYATNYNAGDSYAENYNIMGPVYVEANKPEDFTNSMKYKFRMVK